MSCTPTQSIKEGNYLMSKVEKEMSFLDHLESCVGT